MARIILSIGDTVLREIVLSKERMTIGRRPQNDIVIDDLAVSGEHALIVTRDNDSFLEDLNSTNGTQVNGQPVSKHFLQEGDVVELAQFRITYSAAGSSQDKMHSTAVLADTGRPRHYGPMIQVLNGPSAGKEISLDRALTTLGRPDSQIAVVTQRNRTYFLTHVKGDPYPLLNGGLIGAGPHPLVDGDVIEIADTQMKVFLP